VIGDLLQRDAFATANPGAGQLLAGGFRRIIDYFAAEKCSIDEHFGLEDEV
jgi:hypothetical protein